MSQSQFYDLGMFSAPRAAEQQAARRQLALLIRVPGGSKLKNGYATVPIVSCDPAASKGLGLE